MKYICQTTVCSAYLINRSSSALYRYDRQKLCIKEIHNTQYVACMNPTAGSFTINPRLQVCVPLTWLSILFSDFGSKEQNVLFNAFTILGTV